MQELRLSQQKYCFWEQFYHVQVRMALVGMGLLHIQQVDWSAAPLVANQSCKAMAMVHGYCHEHISDVILTLKLLEGLSLCSRLLHWHVLRQSKFLDTQVSKQVDSSK